MSSHGNSSRRIIARFVLCLLFILVSSGPTGSASRATRAPSDILQSPGDTVAHPPEWKFLVWYEAPQTPLRLIDKDKIIMAINDCLKQRNDTRIAETAKPEDDYSTRLCPPNTCDAVKIVIVEADNMLIPTIYWHDGSKANASDDLHAPAQQIGCNRSFIKQNEEFCEKRLTTEISDTLAKHTHTRGAQ